jgi:catechol 2,3-dioxygenase-like lactoylglutathione lyase family enzyme
MIDRIGMVPIFVSDQQRALEFYRDKLGFEVILDDPYSGYGADAFRWITVAPKKGGTQFILYHPAMNPGDDELENRVGTWTGIVFFTDDIMGTYKTLSERGVQFDGEPKKQPWGGYECFFRDPDGNRFHLGPPAE